MQRRVYMDHHATTPVDPRVLEAMLPFFTEKFGNAASRTHSFGWEADEACERARAQVASLIGSRAKDVVFTSGATESNNLAIRGVMDFHRERGNHIVTVTTEHKAVLDVCHSLEKCGRARVSRVRVGRDGRVDPADIHRAITDETVLVSVMLANNEIGVLQPVREIAAIAHEYGAFFHSDATQAVGKVPVDVEEMGIDLLSLSAHKMYGPKGCGALYVRMRPPRIRLTPLILGGGHERGLRSGTLNVPGVVGMGEACAIGEAEMHEEQERVRRLRDRLWEGLRSRIEDIHRNGSPEHGLAGNLNVTFAHVDGESLLVGLREVAVSSGSACTSATLEPSHVLRAIGLDEEQAQQSIRFGLGRGNTEEEVGFVVDRVADEVARLRAMTPSWRIEKQRAATS